MCTSPTPTHTSKQMHAHENITHYVGCGTATASLHTLLFFYTFTKTIYHNRSEFKAEFNCFSFFFFFFLSLTYFSNHNRVWNQLPLTQTKCRERDKHVSSIWFTHEVIPSFYQLVSLPRKVNMWWKLGFWCFEVCINWRQVVLQLLNL